MSKLEEQLEGVRGRVAAAAARAGRAAESVRLVAVSKAHPPETVRSAYHLGQRLFGENKAQELLAKASLLPGDIGWHFIGHLQSNKVRKVLPRVEMIHSVDSVDLAEDIERVAAELGLYPRVLLQVNVSGEPSKFGFSPERLRTLMERFLEFQRMEIVGLMTLAPYTEDPENVRPFFARLREVARNLESRYRFPLPELSMGMSGDYEVAIEEGATLVRVGSSIFGPRGKTTA